MLHQRAAFAIFLVFLFLSSNLLATDCSPSVYEALADPEVLKTREFYVAAKILKQKTAGTSEVNDTEFMEARQKIVAVLNATIEEGKWQELSFPALHALIGLRDRARDTEPLLWSLMNQKVGPEPDSSKTIAQALAAVSDFGPMTMSKIQEGLSAQPNGLRWREFLSLAASAKEKGYPLKSLMLRPLETDCDAFTSNAVVQALKEVPFDAADTVQIARIFKAELSKPNPNLYHVATLADKLGPHLEGLRPLLLEALAKPKAARYAGKLLGKIGLKAENLDTVEEILSHPAKDGESLRSTLMLVAEMGQAAERLKPKIFDLLGTDVSADAAEALKKVGLTKRDFSQFARQLSRSVGSKPDHSEALELIGIFGKEAAPFSGRILELLDNPVDAYAASEALKKIGLSQLQRQGVAKKLLEARNAGDSDLSFRLSELLESAPTR